MQEIRYTIKVWLSGLLFTPVIYILLLLLFAGFHFPAFSDWIITAFAVPYAFLMSVWVVLGLFATLLLAGNPTFIRRNLSVTTFIMTFAALIMINTISALQNYGGGHLLALAYAISTISFIWLYPFNSSGVKSTRPMLQSIKDAVIYGLTVWLFTFLFSTPISVLLWIITKDFIPISPIKTALDVVERYNFQLSLSVAYFITIALTTLIAINLNIAENKKKAIIFLFAFPLTFPVLFYYLLFSGDIYTHNLFELFGLIFPSVIISALSIWLIDIIPVPKTKD
ncbi:hypothetical protein [Mucilaginibacter sp. BT774]|uniref:hypothetical protein n=1 Tax=Mucilaginibacter sp. BT774 TaxID=3062276 RepID=UPI00267561FD|nr:hypothetical protein [Mucilaginibacter sp. BT774]MDO3628631.1 hypothetical protein [Mucilaginibacter sp. BT774]